NATSAFFVRYKTQTSREESEGTAAFLEDQIVTYAPALAEAEARLQRYREQAHIISPQDQAAEELRRVADLHGRRDILRMERHSLRELLARVDAGRSTGTLSRELAAHPVFLSNGAVQDLLRTISELETERSTLAVRRTDANFDVRAINDRVAEVEDQLLRLARGYLSSVETQVASLDAILSQSEIDLGTIPAREAEFLRLTREQKLLEQVLLMLQTKLKEEEIQTTSETSSVRVLDAALEPRRPVGPRPLMNLLIALVVGSVVGVGLALGREAMDDAVRSEEEVRHVTGGARVVGIIPHTVSSRGALNGGRGNSRWALSVQAGRRPDRTEADAYREIEASLRLGEQGGPRTVVVTGTDVGANRWAVSRGLAFHMARYRARVLLVQADVRGTAHVAGAGNTGLWEIEDERDWTAALAPRSQEGGTASIDLLAFAQDDPHEAFDPSRLGELLSRFAGEYDAVIVDAPDFPASSDAAVLSRHADITVLVAQQGRTDRELLARAVSRLAQMEVAFAGVVLTEPGIGTSADAGDTVRWEAGNRNG
ncbi:MAG: hypothetical protein H0U67_13080, partial [Gemmatimonadetes bacterium]|nr:hypothetical protein [Gemmatimonadota bacterium]